MKIKTAISGICMIAILMLSCDIEDFKKELPLDDAEALPRLVISAGLDSDNFYIFINKSFPISSKEVKITFVEDAKVKLYEDDTLIIEALERDNLVVEGYLYPSLFLLRDSIYTTPGKTYRLEVSSPGFPSVTSTVVAPKKPEIGSVFLNGNERLKAPSSLYISYLAMYYSYFFPLHVEIIDDPDIKNYYMLEVYRNNPVFYWQNEIGIATSDRTLIQDNPIIESEKILSDPDYSMFLFHKLLISDLSFSGKTINLSLLLGDSGLGIGSSGYVSTENRGDARDSSEVNLFVKNLQPEIFEYYRAFMLQNPNDDGTKFFNEPVIIPSNINGGYGYFSVTSYTKRTLTKLYYYY